MTKTNRYYENTFDPSFGSSIKSAGQHGQFDLIQAAFDLIDAQMVGLGFAQGITALAGFPPSFFGSGYQILRVNASESAVEFVANGNMRIIVVAGTTYTLPPEAAGALVVFTSDSAVTVTVDTNANQTFAPGDPVWLFQKGAGKVTLTAAGGVTLESSDNMLSSRGQYALIAVAYIDTDQWIVLGDRDVGSTLGYAGLTTANTFSKAQSVTTVALTDGATINTDASKGNSFYVTLAGTGRTLANPTNLVDGTRYRWYIKQDATGSRTITSYGGAFKFVGGVPTLTTTANAIDRIEGEYVSALGYILCTVVKNFA